MVSGCKLEEWVGSGDTSYTSTNREESGLSLHKLHLRDLEKGLEDTELVDTPMGVHSM